MPLGARRLKDRREGFGSIQVYRHLARLHTVADVNGRKDYSPWWHCYLGYAACSAVLRSRVVVMPMAFRIGCRRVLGVIMRKTLQDVHQRLVMVNELMLDLRELHGCLHDIVKAEAKKQRPYKNGAEDDT